MPVGQVSRNSSPLGAHYEALLYEERLIYFFESSLVLTYCSSNGIGPDRTSLEGIDYGAEYSVVYRVETAGIYLEFVKCIFGYTEVYTAVSHNLGEITDSAKQRIGNTRSAAAAHSNLVGCLIIYRNLEYACTSLYYLLEVFHIIVLQCAGNSESGAKRRGQKAASGSGTYESEWIEGNAHRPGSRTFIYHNIYDEILHGRIQVFLHFRT